jgi:hypothetical protein
MNRSAGIAFLFAGLVCGAATPPFWETKDPSEWTVAEARRLLVESPWAQPAVTGPRGEAVLTYIATADPIIAAEDCVRAALKGADADPSWEEYREYLRGGTGKYIIIAVGVPKPEAFAEAAETKTMLKETKLRIGKRPVALVGHFPPSSTDPYVRFVFERDFRPGDDAIQFQVSVPGTSKLYYAEFRLKELTYRGKLSY